MGSGYGSSECMEMGVEKKVEVKGKEEKQVGGETRKRKYTIRV